MPATVPSILIDDVTVDEAAQVAVFRVYLNTPNWSQSVTVNYGTGGGSATVGADYTNTVGSLTFAPGVTEMFITVPVINDTLSESAETFNVTLSGAANATIGDSVGTAYILDNDNTPCPSVGNATATEGGAMVHTVTLSAAASTPVVYTFSLAGGTATAGTDFSTAATFSNGVTFAGGHITVPVGVTSFTVSYATIDDTLDEANETTVLSICQISGTGNIIDNDNAPTVTSISNPTVTEGATLVHTVTLSNASTVATTYAYALSGVTATAGSDFNTAVTFSNGVTLAGGLLTVPAGVSAFSVSVPTINDAAVESTETTRLTIGGVNGTGTILDNDTVTPSLVVNDVAVNEAAGVAVFTVTLSAASAQTVTVGYNTSNGTAAAGSDYSAITGTLTFAAGQTSKTITVPIINDTVDENNETFNVNLTAATNATIADNRGIGTIIDNDNAPCISTISSPTVTEGATLVHTVTLSNASAVATTYAYALTGVTATAGSDFNTSVTFSNGVTLAGGVLTVPANVTSFTVSVPTINDTAVESTETTRLAIGGVVGTGTILDNDYQAPSISINDVRVDEAAGVAVFTVSLSARSGQVVTVAYNTSNGSAVAAADYTGVTGSLTFAAGQTSKTITVPIINDTIDESNETFNVNLTRATNATIADNLGVGTIIDNDNAPCITSISNPTVTEGASLVHTVTLSNASAVATTYAYSLSGVSATVGSDFTTATTFSNGVTLAGGLLTVPAGVTSFTVSVPTINDTAIESTETTRLTIGGVNGTGTILDNDTPPPTVCGLTYAQATEGAALVHTVTLSGATTAVSTYAYALGGYVWNGATAGSDFSTNATFSNGVTLSGGNLTVPAGVSSFTITYASIDDTILEPTEYTQLSVGGLTNYGYIYDNDVAPPSVCAISAATTTEGGNLVHTVTLSGTTTGAATYAYALGGYQWGGGATAGSDFSTNATFSNGVTLSGGNLTVPAGVSSFSITYATIDDTIVESTEYTQLSVGGYTNYGYINDNDVAHVTPTVCVNAAQVTEGGNLVHTVTLSSTTTIAENYNYSLSGYTATAGTDFSTTATFSNGVTLSAGVLTVPAGVSSFSVTYATTDDAIIEWTEYSQLTIGGNTNYGVILDNDVAPPTVCGLTYAQATEGAALVHTVTLTGATTAVSTYAYALGSYGGWNGATAGSDFSTNATFSNGVTLSGGNLTVPAGVSSFTITYATIDDTILESTEYTQLSVGGLTNYGYIYDNDVAPPSVCAISAATTTEGGNLVHTVTLSGTTTGAATYAYALGGYQWGGGATAGSDFSTNATFSNGVTLSGGNLTVPAGVSSFSITYATIDDSIIESTEYTQLSVGGYTDYGYINDNDTYVAPPTVSYVSYAQVTEGAALVHTVTLSSATTSTATYSYSLGGYQGGGGATAGSDFSTNATFSNGVTLSGGNLTVPAGVSTFTITYGTIDDTVVEYTEYTAVSVGRVNAFGYIYDNDVAHTTPTACVYGAQTTEGGNLVHTVSLSSTTTTTESYYFQLSGYSATAGADFVASPSFSNGVYLSGSQLIVPAGVNSFTVTYATIDDSIVESTEYALLTVGSSQAYGTIYDNDSSGGNCPTVSINNIGYDERAGSAFGQYGSAVFTVSLSSASNESVTVNYSTADGSAVSGNYSGDYMTQAGVLTFAPGVTSLTITVPIYNDAATEAEEQFTVNLSSACNCTISQAQGVCTIYAHYDPLVLDLNGDGVRSIGRDSGVFFDSNNVGVAENTGWVSAQDGLLVRDLNGDGEINNGSELFGSATSDGQGGKAADGFAALALVDSNKDGVVNSLDLGWKDLQVWRDANADGVTDKGELLSMETAGVLSLNLTHTTSDKVENGNLHMLLGDYTTTSGETREMTDVFFASGDRVATEAVALHGQDATATGLTFDPTASVWQVGAEDGNVLIKGFDAEHDVLDLRDLLPGQQGDNLDGLLSIKKEGSSTVIDVKDAAGVDHSIVFAGVDLIGGNTDQQVIHDLLNNHRVVVD